jgi:hypothetical protein
MFVLETNDMLFLVYQTQQYVGFFRIFEPAKEFWIRTDASENSPLSILSQTQMVAKWSWDNLAFVVVSPPQKVHGSIH